ncbi:hypothetical protein [Haloarcula pellucida]|uniref:Uncharacterized protein n=1 Tax=Haloarcula pellucida TaxID=1427151 RepID=A0A830GKC6_9EURY|nr:hypothetical protein [Halomicroarcula pellucida]MBX0348688.1 hypothetical protein [Halomicroarcula pellucida]GGN92200.1 hypothetical protein GCM10009030_16210 [Halomicroarcula pellucida]
MRARRIALTALVVGFVFAVVMTLRYAVYGCWADRFGRCIHWWMIRDYPLGVLVAGVLGLLMGLWQARGEAA